MMTANDVRDVRFSKAVGGYKQDEVDSFLDTVEADYKQYEAYIHSLQEKINTMNSQIEEYKNSQVSLQNVLISAQQLADNIVNDAKAKAEVMVEDAKVAAEKATAEARGILENFDSKLAAKRSEAEQQLKVDLERSKKQHDAVKTAAEEAVVRQQALFDKLRLEVGAFKNDLMEQYKKHIEIVSKLPDCVAMDATRAANAVNLDFEQNTEQSVAVPETEIKQEIVADDGATIISENLCEATEGFVVNTTQDSTHEDIAESGGFSNSFFNRNK